MTCIDEFQGNILCPTIKATEVDAYFQLSLDPVNSTVLRLETSWGCTAVDLWGAMRASETITTLFLSPVDNPVALQYNREDYGVDGAPNGGVDCIHGDDLSRIISMQLLKDVSQVQRIKDGHVYMWNAITNLFEPYDLQTFVNVTNQTLELHASKITNLETTVEAIQNTLELVLKRLANLESRMTNVENRLTVVEGDVANLKQRVSAIENAIYNWGNDKTTKIARGNINVYGGTTQSVAKNRYIATHDTNTNVTGDVYFAS